MPNTDYIPPDLLAILAQLVTIDVQTVIQGRGRLSTDIRDLDSLTPNERRLCIWADEHLLPAIRGLEQYAEDLIETHQREHHAQGHPGDRTACHAFHARLSELGVLHGELADLYDEKSDEMWRTIRQRHTPLDESTISLVGDGLLVEVPPPQRSRRPQTIILTRQGVIVL